MKAAIKGKIDGVARNVSPIFRDGERASFHPLSRDLLEAYDALVQSYAGIRSSAPQARQGEHAVGTPTSVSRRQVEDRPGRVEQSPLVGVSTSRQQIAHGNDDADEIDVPGYSSQCPARDPVFEGQVKEAVVANAKAQRVRDGKGRQPGKLNPFPDEKDGKALMTAETFVHYVMGIWVGTGATDSEMHVALSNCFRGLYASQFIVGNPIATFSMAEFVRRFYNTYVACDVSVKLASAQNRKQQPDERVEQYLVDKFLLCDSAKITGLIRYTMARDGLLPELSLKVQEEETSWMAVLADNELLSSAKHLEEIAESKRTLEGQARPSPSRSVKALPAKKQGEPEDGDQAGGVDDSGSQ